MRNLIVLPFFVVLLLNMGGCKSTPKSIPQSKAEFASGHTEDLNKAFAARGFYRTPKGNINYLTSRQCANYQLQSHRGSVRFPENSIRSVVDALDNDFDVVEIDVQVTRDGVWVVHHDKRTGRETGTIDNRNRKIEQMSYEKEWGYLRTRDQISGNLLDIVPPTFKQIASAFAQSAKKNQLLNIEIKSSSSTRDLEMLDYLAFSILGKSKYFYSSLDLNTLERMRDINSTIFLSFIQRPAKKSLDVLREQLVNHTGFVGG